MLFTEKLKVLPGILELRRYRYERSFANDQVANYFRGVYETFNQASENAPKSKPIGYNNKASAGMYKERTKQVYSTDYPVLYWMMRLQDKFSSVFDFGGHIGIHFYSYAKYLDFSRITEWLVCDVKSVIEEARSFKLFEPRSSLSFSNDFFDIEGADLFLANGSLQYLEWELHEKLEQITNKPKFLILNMLPLHSTHKTITLQSIGTSFCPYYVRLRKEFVEGLNGIGYKLLDEWDNEQKACKIAFEPERSLNKYKGMIFELKK
ncbi:MAG: methyltransferase, TIGR04325 family [Halobacteriovoraceae bacterium]|nr:methyltransferase, TIGR04325 family [Halobacteriovoraceae bacterium]|tara:strand:+ start:106 stop:897 length:792 start_codon:yes stop_codon:yes gene_type:complete